MILVRYGASLGDGVGKAFRDAEGHTPLDLISLLIRDDERNRDKCSCDSSSVGGQLYSFGKPDFQLGYHALTKSCQQSSARKIEIPALVSNFSAGRYHTAAVSTAGDVYTWGFGKGGRLGNGYEYKYEHSLKIF